MHTLSTLLSESEVSSLVLRDNPITGVGLQRLARHETGALTHLQFVSATPVPTDTVIGLLKFATQKRVTCDGLRGFSAFSPEARKPRRENLLEDRRHYPALERHYPALDQALIKVQTMRTDVGLNGQLRDLLAADSDMFLVLLGSLSSNFRMLDLSDNKLKGAYHMTTHSIAGENKSLCSISI